MGSKRPFLFVSVEQPNGRPTSAGQKSVRSWVTKAQHVHRRHLKGTAGDHGDVEEAHAPSNLPSPVIAIFSTNVEPGTASPRPNKIRRSKTDETTTTRRRSMARPHRQASEGPVADVQNRRAVISPDVPNEIFAYDHLSSNPSPFVQSSWDEELPTALLHPGLDDPADMLSIYAAQLDTDPRTIWAHYLWQEREHGSMFRTQYPQFHGYASTCLHPLILSDPAMLATTVLFTACHLRYQHGEDVMSPTLLRIHSTAYKLVQSALDRFIDQLSDATFLAVIKLALFEMIFGNRTAFETHMYGIAQMVRLRNRPAPCNFGLDSYTAHILVWFDGNLSAAARTPRYLEGEMSLADVKSPLVDTEKFLLGVR